MLIAEVSRLPTLHVISRTSVGRYKDTQLSLPEISAELGADLIVEGSILKDPEGIRLVLQLIEGRADRHMWTETFVVPPSEVPTGLRQAARSIAEALDLPLTEIELRTFSAKRPVVAEAYEAFLRGRFFWSRRNPADFLKAREWFQRATELDPGLAEAHAGLAYTHFIFGFYGISPPRTVFPEGKRHFERALELDDRLSLVYSGMAGYSLFFEWDLAGAEQHLLRALELNPSDTLAMLAYADVLSARREHDAAIDLIRRARRLDPFDLGMNMNVGDMLQFARRSEDAIDEYRRALEMNPRFLRARLRLVRALADRGEVDAAAEHIATARELGAAEYDLARAEAYVAAGAGDEAATLAAIARLEATSTDRYVSPYDVAEIHARLGDHDLAFAWLDKAMEERTGWLIFLGVEFSFDSMRDDPRFRQYLRAVGLEAPHDAS